MSKEFKPEDIAHLKELISFIGKESETEQDAWKIRAGVTIGMLREQFPELDDKTLAAFCAAVSYVVGEISFSKVADAGRMINVIYMSYTLATAHLLGIYEAGSPSAAPPPAPDRPWPGQYL